MDVNFTRAVWLVPLTVVIRFAEECPFFARWAARHLNPSYTWADWRRVHLLGLLFVSALTSLASFSPNRIVIFLFVVLSLANMPFNLIFHASFSVLCRSYSPGLISAILFYPPVTGYLVMKIGRANLLTPALLVSAFVLGGFIHVLDVANNVIFVGRRSSRISRHSA